MMITEERLGLLYTRLNTWQWDPLLGDEPPGFADLGRDDKYEIVIPVFNLVEHLLGDAGCSKWWWIHHLGRTEEEWRHWYYVERIERDKRLFPQEDI